MFRVQDAIQESFPGRKNPDADGAAELVPVFASGADRAPASPIERVGQFEDLVTEKGQEV